MSSNKKYRCVNCGEPSSALYKTYGPTVLKLTKCVRNFISFYYFIAFTINYFSYTVKHIMLLTIKLLN